MESIFGGGNGIHEDQSEDSEAECGKDKIAYDKWQVLLLMKKRIVRDSEGK